MTGGSIQYEHDGRLVELIGDTFGLLEVDELRWGLLAALRRTTASDFASLNDVGPTPETVVSIIEPDQPSSTFEVWAQYAQENPILSHYQRTGDGGAVRFSDVISETELRRLPIYQQLYAPMGVEHQVAFTLPGAPGRVLAVALSRGGSDYSDEDCAFLNRARPFLIQAYRNALAFESLRLGKGDGRSERIVEALRSAGLTRREAEVLRMVALGRSNQHIAAVLGISYRTVGKHLEHGFRKLGVGDRSTAAGRAWELAEAAALNGSGAMANTP
ncbi:MAG TPA: LuxR C-terminal-related transcriptional regulator [Solirubrobacteraceae bacterium]|jgi:DNA-binding CsgD family transcriptional regulator|nr:LuxR C-terminal-related transcriptional regulator [Solirubrobacteraceae bacterium]